MFGLYNAAKGPELKVRILSSFFMPKLLSESDNNKYCYKAVSRWTKGGDIFLLYDKILIPVNHRNTHWFLIVVDMGARTVRAYDSLGWWWAQRPRLEATLR
jgi:Ulp1 family protease